MGKNPLERFFSAKSIAVIGVSRNERKPGHVVAETLIEKFYGDIFLVSTSRIEELLGRRVYHSVMEIEDIVDLAVILTPAPTVPEIIRECAKKRIKNVIISSGGFAEMGNSGKELQKELVGIIQETGIRVIGPNCIGVYSPMTGLDTMFIPVEKLQRPGPGHVSFLTQSGAYGVAFLNKLSLLGYGRWISKFISFGNAIDINETHILDYLEEDDQTKVIFTYLEGFKNGREFMKRAKEIQKPMIMIKANRTVAGSKASLSHTASLSVNDIVVDDLFHQSGIIRANTWEEGLDLVKIFAMQPPPRGRNVAILTDGGGAGVMTSDAVAFEGLFLATLTEETKQDLRKAFPSYYLVENPVDLTGSVQAPEFVISLQKLLEDSNVDTVILIAIPAPSLDVQELVEGLYPLVSEAEKTIVGLSFGGVEAGIITNKLEKLGIPTYSEEYRAIRALRIYTDYNTNHKDHKLK
ncbi:MAG: acetate--CoA ligase family protein [Candidatus Heimdallarchaeota archaeon]